VLVAALAIGAHLPVLFGGFAWLDHGDLETGAAIAPFGQWLQLFGRGFARTGFYRPLPALSLSFDALFGGGPLPFHLHALLAHAAVAVSLGFTAEALGASRRASLAAAAVFAVHPIGGYVSGLVAFRPELLMALALCWLAWAAKHQLWPLAFGAAVFAALSKETAVVLGPLMVLVLRARPKVLGAALAASAGALVLRLSFAPPWHAQPAVAGFLPRLTALGRGVIAMALPFDTALCDATPLSGLTVPTVAGVLAVPLVIAVAMFRRPAGALFALALLPALNLVALPRFWSLHYFYLPMMMLVLVVAHRWLLMAVAVLSGLSLLDAPRFKSDEALWAADCREGGLYLGDAFRAQGELDRAAAAYQRAIDEPKGLISFGDVGAAYQNLGLTRLGQGRLDEAQSDFEQALQRTVNGRERRMLNHDLAAISFARGDYADVERRLSPEAARPDAFPESIELLKRSRAAASLLPQP
jgi:tetratricopeptide (TPR) repeat protein